MRPSTLRDHGVSREFVMEAHDLGYRFTPGELVQLHDHGVDGKYLRTIRDSGMKQFERRPDRAIARSRRGVGADW
jgi:hypothetical protein